MFLVPIFQIFRIKLCAVLLKAHPMQTLGVTGSLQELYVAGRFAYSWSIHPAFVF